MQWRNRRRPRPYCFYTRSAKSAKRSQVKADDHYRDGGSAGPPYAAAMAIPRPSRFVTIDAISRPPNGRAGRRGVECPESTAGVMTVMRPFPPIAVALTLVVVSTGCRPAQQRRDSGSRYLVTESPINVGVSPDLCVALDPNDQHGVWWWEPGASGCRSRSTGPGVFDAEQAVVSHSSTGSIAAGFRLPTHSETRPLIEVRLHIEGSRMRALETGAQVSVQTRVDLDLPEMPPAGGRRRH